MSHHSDTSVVDGEQRGDSLQFDELSDEVSHGDKDKIFSLQKWDTNLAEAWIQVAKEVEASPVCYYIWNNILMRKWWPLDARPNEDWKVVEKIVLLKGYQTEVLNQTRESPLASRLEINKVYHRIQQHFSGLV